MSYQGQQRDKPGRAGRPWRGITLAWRLLPGILQRCAGRLEAAAQARPQALLSAGVGRDDESVREAAPHSTANPGRKAAGLGARNVGMGGLFRAFLLADARTAPMLVFGFGLLISFATGCNTVASHEVLTFFFTGVPPPGEEEKQQEEERPAAVAARQRAVIVKATNYSHGPYAANECYRCHEVSASGGYRGFGKKEEAAGALAKPGIVPGKMVAPYVELCTGCHDTKSPMRAASKGLWVHGPVSAGYCILCHSPHAGPEPYMLLKKPNEQCVECHTGGMILSQAVHKEKSDCVSCHNPHLGKDARLLKAEYREDW
jgi:predicted CXXCH cytochrome family protein